MDDKYFESWWNRVKDLSEIQKVTLASVMFGVLEAHNYPREGFERILRMAKGANLKED